MVHVALQYPLETIINNSVYVEMNVFVFEINETSLFMPVYCSTCVYQGIWSRYILFAFYLF